MNYNLKYVIVTYSIITGNDNTKSIIKTLSKSDTFRALRKGNKLLRYEGYSSNLLDIADDLKSQPDCPQEVYRITPEAICIANRARKAESKMTKERKKTEAKK